MTTSTKVRLAVDVMGGDHGVRVTVPACLAFLRRHPTAEVLLVGAQKEIEGMLSTIPDLPSSGLRVCPASEVVTMDDSPGQAMRKKRDSSMHIAASLVRDKEAEVAVSAGNTGAWMAISSFIIRNVERIDRPAICAPLPSRSGSRPTYVLDLGANVDCKPHHLLQFALLGSAYVGVMENISRPKVGLLNIGTEEIKGNELVKASAELLVEAGRAGRIDFVGSVEGTDMFTGTVDVVVCDGFVGNVALKTAEGFAHLMSHALKDELFGTILGKAGSLLLMPSLRRFRQKYDPRQYNGACLLGLNGLVVKSHGGADVLAFGVALNRAERAVSHGLSSRIAEVFTAS